jgi:phospholipid N-methyltransferase
MLEVGTGIAPNEIVRVVGAVLPSSATTSRKASSAVCISASVRAALLR